MLMFKTIRGLSPEYLQNLFSIRSTLYNQRDSELKVDSPKPCTNYSKRSFSSSGALLLYSLPIYLRKLDSLGRFKGKFANLITTVSQATTRKSCKTVYVNGFDNSDGRALHRYRKGRGFESRLKPEFFFQVFVSIVLCLHSHPSSYLHLIATVGHLLLGYLWVNLFFILL